MKLNHKAPIISKMLILAIMVISCHSNSQNMEENNKEVENFNTTERYPNKKNAYVKNGDQVFFYTPNQENVVYVETNLKSHIFKIKNIDLLNTVDLLEISSFDYFSPKKYSTFYKYPIGESGTAGGDFFTLIEFNELGLIKSVEKNLPEIKNKYLYKYNKYGQILKIVEDQLLDKVLFENKYDKKARLVSQKNNNKESKSERTFFYDNNDRIQKENIKEKEIAPNGKVLKDETYTLNYEYNKGQLIRKYTEDKSHVFDYQYGLVNNKLISIVEYDGLPDHDDSKKLINHFVKNTYVYNDDQIVEEKSYAYSIVNVSILVDKKWQPIAIERQRELAWEKLKDQSELPLSGIEKKYSYQSNDINITVNKLKFSNSIIDGKTKQNRELVESEIIKYKLDDTGRIIKKEKYNKNKNLEKMQEFSY